MFRLSTSIEVWKLGSKIFIFFMRISILKVLDFLLSTVLWIYVVLKLIFPEKGLIAVQELACMWSEKWDVVVFTLNCSASFHGPSYCLRCWTASHRRRSWRVSRLCEFEDGSLSSTCQRRDWDISNTDGRCQGGMNLYDNSKKTCD